jgi:hypothetical protein
MLRCKHPLPCTVQNDHLSSPAPRRESGSVRDSFWLGIELQSAAPAIVPPAIRGRQKGSQNEEATHRRSISIWWFSSAGSQAASSRQSYSWEIPFEERSKMQGGSVPCPTTRSRLSRGTPTRRTRPPPDQLLHRRDGTRGEVPASMIWNPCCLLIARNEPRTSRIRPSQE